MDTLADRLKQARADLGNMTQGEVVEELKRRHNITIRQSHISNLEIGLKQPSLELLAALAQVYETSVDYLLGITDNALSARDMERELRTGGINGRMGQLMADLSDETSISPTGILPLDIITISDILLLTVIISERWRSM